MANSSWPLLLVIVVMIGGCARSGASEGQAEPEAAAPTGVILSGNLERGPFRVGFSRNYLRSSAGQAAAGAGQPTGMDVFRWYPVAEGAQQGPVLSYADYYQLQAGVSIDQTGLRQRLYDDMTSPPGVADETLDQVLAASTWAVADADPAPGPFPLVLWSYRDSIPTMHTVLAEYLASHGYVVVFGWPADNVPPPPWEAGLTVAAKQEALDVQVRLLEAVLDELATDGGVDSSRVAVLAWSYGGESAHILQRRRAQIRVVVGLDANLASGWVFQPAELLAALDPGDFVAPHVLIRHGSPRRGAPETASPAPLVRAAAGAWYVRMPRLHHGNFNLPGGMIPGLLGLDEVSDWAVGGADAQLGYEAVSRLTLSYLNAALGAGAGDPVVTLPELPEGFLEVHHYPPTR